MKATIFIDGAYLDKVCELHFNRARIDYNTFSKLVALGHDVDKILYYHCPPYMGINPGPTDEERLRRKEGFFHAISSIPMLELRLGKLAFRGRDINGKPIFVQKSVDVMMAVDMVTVAAMGETDKVVMVAGDTDFIPAIKAVSLYDIPIDVWLYPNSQNAINELSTTTATIHTISSTLVREARRA